MEDIVSQHIIKLIRIPTKYYPNLGITMVTFGCNRVSTKEIVRILNYKIRRDK